MESETDRKNNDVEEALLKKAVNTVDISFEDYYKNYEVNDGTRLASKKSYTIVYGLIGCLYTASFSYFNGTISTIEKRLQISSTSTGLISTGNNISQTCFSIFLSYYVSKQHRPRWLAIGILAVVFFCFFNLLPHFIYGPGDLSLSLTEEYGAQYYKNITEVLQNMEENDEINDLCTSNRSRFSFDCKSDSETSESNISQFLLFFAQFISGLGGAIFGSLGISYMDDNIQKAHAPMLLSATTFIRMMGPVIGFSLSSFTLNQYIAPHLHPVIDRKDPRWIGAWWLGWILLGILLFFGSFILSLFPRNLPRAKARRDYQKMIDNKNNVALKSEPNAASWKDMKKTLYRLITNKVLMCTNFSMVFMLFGYMPYQIYGPKYMEVQFKISSSMASMVSGSLSLVFPSVGLILSGIIITKYQPRGRVLAAWALFGRIYALFAIICYSLIGCEENDTALQMTMSQNSIRNSKCDISSCNCEFMKYLPICGTNNVTYISPCHGGCLDKTYNGTLVAGYNSCSCIPPFNFNTSSTNYSDYYESSFDAVPGSCPIDCTKYFLMFLLLNSIGKFIGGTQMVGSFLLGFRSINERDKAVSVSLTMLLLNITSYIPAPVLFGYIFDKACIFWGKTCEGDGNCWLYDSYSLRKTMNHTAAVFVFFGVIFEMFVWYYAKNVTVFDQKNRIDKLATEDENKTEKNVESKENNTVKESN